jgi:hypothetical protein
LAAFALPLLPLALIRKYFNPIQPFCRNFLTIYRHSNGYFLISSECVTIMTHPSRHCLMTPICNHQVNESTIQTVFINNLISLEISTLAGAAGFEPANDGIKSRCLTTWRRPISLTWIGSIAAEITLATLSI